MLTQASRRIVNMERNLARALYTNLPEAKNELFFRKGDILTVIEVDYKGQRGWWLCSLLGESGLCPGNYLQLLKNEYQNLGEDVTPCYDVPKAYSGSLFNSTTLNPEDLYDVPKSHLPIYNSASVVRSRKHGSDVSLLSTGSSNRVSSASSASSSAQSTTSSENSYPVRFNERNLRFQKESPLSPSPIYTNEEALEKINRFIQDFSITSNSLQSTLVQDTSEVEYDIPRPSVITSRPMSSMSGNRECVGLENSDSKDSLDLYDVPRSVKNCVSIFENKYDHLHQRPSTASSDHRRDSFKRSSVCSSASSSNGSNPQSSVDKHFDVILRNTGNLRHADSICSNGSKSGNSDETYDVPPTASSRFGSIKSWSASTCSNLDQNFYDMPTDFSTLASICGPTETLPYHENFRASSRRSDAFGNKGTTSSITPSFVHIQPSSPPAEVKFLPLCPKAAVTVCEKLRQEVITAIHSILSLNRPMWRMKDNLKEIMPELRFGCVRLNLGVKDFTDFCSRTVSNAKKFGLEPLVIRLQKLLAPLTNGSQIIQKDVDELEAYLWSVDRLSVPANENNVSADALDQLVLCARSLQHDVTEIANFIALNSTALFRDVAENMAAKPSSTPEPECTIEDTQDDYDYVTLSSTEVKNSAFAQAIVAKSNPLDSIDQQILDFYSAQIAVIAPLLSESISTFISSVHQNDPPKVFNCHLKYVILLAYKMLFAGDTIHRNVSNSEVKMDVEMKSDQLHKAVLELHEASKLATRDFPKVLPMQNIIDHVWETTSAAAQLKKVIFSATL